MNFAATIAAIRVTIGVLPTGTGSSQTLDLLKNGTSVYTTPTNRPSFAPGGSQGFLATNPSTLGCVTGDYYTANLVTAGSPSAGGSDIVMRVWWTF